MAPSSLSCPGMPQTASAETFTLIVFAGISYYPQAAMATHSCLHTSYAVFKLNLNIEAGHRKNHRGTWFLPDATKQQI